MSFINVIVHTLTGIYFQLNLISGIAVDDNEQEGSFKYTTQYHEIIVSNS